MQKNWPKVQRKYSENYAALVGEWTTGWTRFLVRTLTDAAS
jgi:hypothetical protein